MLLTLHHRCQRLKTKQRRYCTNNCGTSNGETSNGGTSNGRTNNGGTSNGGASTTWTGIVQELDLTLDNPTVCALITVHAAQKGSLLLAARMATDVFSLKDTTMHILGNGNRTALCLALLLNKPYCQSCWLFGDPSAMQNRQSRQKRPSGESVCFG